MLLANPWSHQRGKQQLSDYPDSIQGQQTLSSAQALQDAIVETKYVNETPYIYFQTDISNRNPE
jgi:hypothetical protein